MFLCDTSEKKKKRNEPSKEGSSDTLIFVFKPFVFFYRHLLSIASLSTGKIEWKSQAPLFCSLLSPIGERNKKDRPILSKMGEKVSHPVERPPVLHSVSIHTHKRLCTVLLNDKKKSDVKQIIMQMSHDGYKQEKKFLSRWVTLMSSCHSKKKHNKITTSK